MPNRFTAGPSAPPTEVPESTSRLADALHQLDSEHRRIRVIFAERLGVSAAEFSLLMRLGESGALTPKALGHELGLTTGAMTAMVDRLDAAGYVGRRPNPADRRSVFVQLSPAGEAARAWVYGRYFAAIGAALETSTALRDPAVAGLLEHLASTIRTGIRTD